MPTSEDSLGNDQDAFRFKLRMASSCGAHHFLRERFTRPAIGSLLRGVVCGFMYALSLHAVAAPGDRDATFGDNGEVILQLGASAGADAIVAQGDGRILVAGTSSAAKGFTVVRLNANGSLDETFGTRGVRSVDFSTAGGGSPRAMVLQPDGKIIVGGASEQALNAPDKSQFALVRFNSNGSLDASFGVAGKVTTTVDVLSKIDAIALQADGKIVVAGTGSIPADPKDSNAVDISHLIVARYMSNGLLDASFGSGGIAVTPFGLPALAGSLLIQADGHIVAVGATDLVARPFGGDQLDTAVVRYRVDGSVDAIFDPFAMFGGLMMCPGIGHASMQKDGNIVIACSIGVVRFRPDIVPDPDFGQLYVPGSGPAYGIADISYGADASAGFATMALQPNGRIVVANTASGPGGNRFALARLNVDGSSDTTFGTAGVVLMPALIAGSKYGDQVSAIALQSDGKILVAGLATDSNGNSSIAVVRYQGDPNTPLVDNNQHGLTGSWYQPTTAGQGFEVEVYPDTSGPGVGTMQVSWFTYDTDANRGHRWYTLSGSASNGQPASLTIYENSIGKFNAPPITTAHAVGKALLSFDSCTSGLLTYRFSNAGAAGSIPLTRLTQNVTCTPTGTLLTNADFALSGNWYDPATSGQGITVEINPISGAAFFAWYTYKPENTPIGAEGQRWYTGQGTYSPGARSIPMQLYQTYGGVLNAPTPSPTTVAAGAATLTFQGCRNATLDFRFSDAPKTTKIVLQRVGPVPPGCTQ
ncbi:MAG TPA: hypothetical protein VJV77_08005 [Casimicrobiaceae bacterium]|nr:hypothetical protein [Casimicrobiaceae bacterium]